MTDPIQGVAIEDGNLYSYPVQQSNVKGLRATDAPQFAGASLTGDLALNGNKLFGLKLLSSVPSASDIGDNGLACAFIPEPVNLGYSERGLQSEYSNNYVYSFPITVTEAGQISKLYFYSEIIQNVRVGIYSDSSGSPNTKLAESPLDSVSAGEWHEFTLISPLSVTAGIYWIALVFDTVGAGNVERRLEGTDKYMSYTYDGTLPSVFTVDGTGGDTVSFYAVETINGRPHLYVNINGIVNEVSFVP